MIRFMSLRIELAQLVMGQRSIEAERFEGVSDLRVHAKAELQRIRPAISSAFDQLRVSRCTNGWTQACMASRRRE